MCTLFDAVPPKHRKAHVTRIPEHINVCTHALLIVYSLHYYMYNLYIIYSVILTRHVYTKASTV